MSRQRLLLTLAAIAVVALFAQLGRWQLARAEFKERAAAGVESALAAPERPLQEALAQQPPSLPQRVRAERGRYPDIRPLLLDNQVRGRRNGMSVYRLFDPGAGAPLLLVDMGWVPWPVGRELPALPAPRPAQRPHGLLLPWPGQALSLGPPPGPDAEGTPWLLPRLRREEIEAALQVRLFDGVLELDPQADHGHLREPANTRQAMPPARHRGYAFQWFALAAAVVVVYGVVTWKTRRN